MVSAPNIHGFRVTVISGHIDVNVDAGPKIHRVPDLPGGMALRPRLARPYSAGNIAKFQ